MSEHTVKAGENQLTVDERGAWVTQLTVRGDDVLFPRTRFGTHPDETKVRGGCHVCLPQFGPARNEHDLSQHGFGRLDRWTLQSADRSSLVLGLAPPHQDYQGLQAVLAYRLTTSSLTMELALYNDSSHDMRIAPAFHPYFATGTAATIGVNDQTIPVDDYEATRFMHSDTVELEAKQRLLKLHSAELQSWALWSDRLDDYFCVEPTLDGNRFLVETPEEDELLPANAHAAYSFTISW